jgi:hypothetical protein
MKKSLFILAFVMTLILGIVIAMCCKSMPAETVTTVRPASPIRPVVSAVPAVQTVHAYNDYVVVYDKNTGLIMDGAREYTVRRGDTLSNIARHEMGCGFYYPIIMLSSHGTVVNPDKIEPGMKLTIPDIAKNRGDEKAKNCMKNYLLYFANIEKSKSDPDQALIDGLRKEVEKL